jgi:hypothetical protein
MNIWWFIKQNHTVVYYWFTNIDRIWRFWMVLPLLFFFLNTNAPYMSMKRSNMSSKAQVATTVACTFRGRLRSYSSCSWSRTSPFLHRWLVSIRTARSRCAISARAWTRTARTRVPSRARAKGGLKHVCAHTSIWAEAKGITRVVGTSELCWKLGMDYERGTIAWAAVLPSSTSGKKGGPAITYPRHLLALGVAVELTQSVHRCPFL